LGSVCAAVFMTAFCLLIRSYGIFRRVYRTKQDAAGTCPPYVHLPGMITIVWGLTDAFPIVRPQELEIEYD